jgi:hypothetical protein
MNEHEVDVLFAGKEDTCPVCGEGYYNISYSGEAYDDTYIYHCMCNICKTKFNEVYSLKYEGQIITEIG